MENLRSLRGVFAPVVTPFRKDLSPNSDLFMRHCAWLLANGCSGLAVFGTNSEANSLTVGERMQLLECLVNDGIPAHKLMPGTGCSAIEDSIELTTHAVRLGCAGVLMLPPFYYKGVSDEGLFRSFSRVIERVGDTQLRIYLYHIPQMSGVPITLSLTERLLDAYPRTIAGIKDSSGDWAHTQRFLGAFASKDFDVYAGTELLLLKNLRAGGAGCIAAGANVNPHGIGAVYHRWQSDEADALQERVDAIRKLLQTVPVIPALKAVVARATDDPTWAIVRPPLVELSDEEKGALLCDLDSLGFKMPRMT